ncbi:MAG: hypothetical protein A2091_02175 [Desulfuromonadales bacterium GWD2_61_12]|nr:MAG: hypothetical protein A2091_02175 [Desulfuromonadales bacterium GWD2_61_12]
MHIVALFGSPRKEGNSATVTEHFLRCAETLGATTERFFLNDLPLRGCQACNACKSSHDHCVISDGLSAALEAVFHADLVVMATPVYYGDVTAQLKAFIDRTYSYLKPGYIALKEPSRLPGRKPLVFVLTQGHRDPAWFADILPRYSEIFRWTDFAETHPLRVIDVYHPGDVQQREDILRQAETLARTLVGGGD